MRWRIKARMARIQVMGWISPIPFFARLSMTFSVFTFLILSSFPQPLPHPFIAFVVVPMGALALSLTLFFTTDFLTQFLIFHAVRILGIPTRRTMEPGFRYHP